jgi:hypothetical protein
MITSRDEHTYVFAFRTTCTSIACFVFIEDWKTNSEALGGAQGVEESKRKQMANRRVRQLR